MRTRNISTALIMALAMATTTLVACTGQRGGAASQDKAAVAVDSKKLLTQDDVDDAYKDKITGERFRVTYDDTDMFKGAESPLVTIVEFSDYPVPVLLEVHRHADEVVKDPAYAKDVRVVFKQFPLPMHKDAAYGLRGVARRRRAGQVLGDARHPLQEPEGDDPRRRREVREQLGLDMAKFKADSTSRSTRPRSTPTWRWASSSACAAPRASSSTASGSAARRARSRG
jgi:hypothetical protein